MFGNSPVLSDQAKNCKTNVDDRKRRSWKTRHPVVVTTALADEKEGAAMPPNGISTLWICFSLKSYFFFVNRKNFRIPKCALVQLEVFQMQVFVFNKK